MINEIFEFNRELLGVHPKAVPHMEHKHAMFNVKAIREEAKELEDEHSVGGNPQVPMVYGDPNMEAARQQTVKSVDALIDAAYFAIGGLARAGLTVEHHLRGG